MAENSFHNTERTQFFLLLSGGWSSAKNWGWKRHVELFYESVLVSTLFARPRLIMSSHTVNSFVASPTLARIARGSLCTGCGACAGLMPDKIAMTEADPGYLRPVQSETLAPSEEDLFAQVCPGLGEEIDPAGRQTHTLWGPFVRMQQGWATDPQLRHAGSSGGALSAMLAHVLAEGIVDAVVQTAAAEDFPARNALVISTEPAGIRAAAGSRYAPSAPLSELRTLAGDGRRFAFVGKPCDAAALRSLISAEPDFGRVFPVIFSFFCAGVPSHAGGRVLVGEMGASEDELERFRYRGNGWPGSAVATLRDGSQRSKSYFDSWGQVLSKHVQSRCKICADGTGMLADVVCADAWECDEAGYPLFDEAPGVSLIVARTDLGKTLIDAAKQAGALQTAPFDLEKLSAMQPGQRGRRQSVLSRLLALRLAGKPVPRYRGLHLLAAARQSPPWRNLKNFLGTLRRIYQGRL